MASLIACLLYEPNIATEGAEAWIGLKSKYPGDFSHLGLISAGEALMALGENTEARRLLEQSEGVLDASPRYKDRHCRNVGLLADVTARIGDREAAAAWAEKLRAMACRTRNDHDSSSSTRHGANDE